MRYHFLFIRQAKIREINYKQCCQECRNNPLIFYKANYQTLNFYLLQHLISLLWDIVAVQSLSCVRLFVTPWTAACQDPLSATISRSLLRFMFIKSVMLTRLYFPLLILYCPLLFLPPIFPNIWIFSNELTLRIRWPNSSSFSNSPSNEYLNIQCGLTGVISQLSKGFSRAFSSTTV